jgi:hypothetical protein
VAQSGPVVGWLKQAEVVDVVDHGNDFNPFALRDRSREAA